MGLDITAYSKLVRTEGYSENDNLPDDVTRLYVNAYFPGRADQITNGYYEYDDSLGFCAGSYGDYNDWRDELIKIAGYSKGLDEISAGDGPFSELIAFSDCEGVIGVTHCKKLAKDFADFQSKSDAHENERFRNTYTNFRKAFELASNDGAVEFH